MSMQDAPPSIVKFGTKGTVDVANPPTYIVVRPGGELTFTRATPFYLTLDREHFIDEVTIGKETQTAAGELKFGPATAITVHFKRVTRVECLAYVIDSNDPVIIIDPN